MLVKTNGGFMIKRKDRIIISALELLEEGGINNVTTKNLARKQNISEPALYRQFKNKHDIVVAMIEEYANYDEKIMNTIREHEMKGKDAIVYYVTRYGELYQSYSEISVILYSLDLYFYEDDTRALVKSILKTRDDFLKNQLNKYPVPSSILTCNQLAIHINDMLMTEVFKWKLANKTYRLIDVLLDRVSILIP